MDKFASKPLHHMTRSDAISEVIHLRGELLSARQRIKDLEGEVTALLECDGYQPTKHDVRKVATTRG